MSLTVLRLLGERFAHKTLAQNSHAGGFLDIKLGFSMLKDRRVSIRPKLLAVGLGAGLIAVIVGLELPLESILSVIVPGLGLAAVVVTDSMETFIGTVGLAAIILPHVAPKLLTQQICSERAGIIEEPIVAAAAVKSIAPMAEPFRSNYDLPTPTQKLIYPRS